MKHYCAKPSSDPIKGSYKVNTHTHTTHYNQDDNNALTRSADINSHRQKLPIFSCTFWLAFLTQFTTSELVGHASKEALTKIKILHVCASYH